MSKNQGSKDKGTKNQKKAPADKSSGTPKNKSAYKSEQKSGSGGINVPPTKPDNKKSN
jgi:hypothetical protein